MPRKPQQSTQPHSHLQGAMWEALRSHPAQTKELLKSPAWADFLADLAVWRNRQLSALTSQKLDAQDLGKVQGVLGFIDVISRLTL